MIPHRDTTKPMIPLVYKNLRVYHDPLRLSCKTTQPLPQRVFRKLRPRPKESSAKNKEQKTKL